MSTMTLKIAKSEGRVEFSECHYSGTLGGALKVSDGGPVGPVLGNEEKRSVRGGTWELAPNPGVEVYVTPSRLSWNPRSGAGGSGLRGPWKPRESSGEVTLAMGEEVRCVGVRVRAGPSPRKRVSLG